MELGPIFANFVLADEINRAPAKVQSALLEVMAERQVSIAGITHPVPEPFLVLATQNPIESEGVYALPEAQRDRFLLKVVIGYPTPMEELEIVRRMGVDAPSPEPALDISELLELQRLTDTVYVDPAVVWYAVSIVFATRAPGDQGFDDLVPLLAYGASPRATLGLVAAARALALIRGRTYVLPQDVYDVAPEVLRHRIVLSYEALADGVDADHVVQRIVTAIQMPRIAPGQARDRPVDDGATAPGPQFGRGRAAPRVSDPVLQRAGPQTTPLSGSIARRSRARVGSSSMWRAVSTGCCRAIISAWFPRRAQKRAKAVSTESVTTSGAWTGRSLPVPVSPTCGTRSRIGSSRRGWSSTDPPASTSAPPSVRSATSRSRRSPPSGS